MSRMARDDNATEELPNTGSDKMFCGLSDYPFHGMEEREDSCCHLFLSFLQANNEQQWLMSFEVMLNCDYIDG